MSTLILMVGPKLGELSNSGAMPPPGIARPPVSNLNRASARALPVVWLAHRQQIGSGNCPQRVAEEMYLQSGAAQLTTQPLGIGQTDGLQSQQIGHALFQVVPRHRQIAQISR